MSSVALAMLGVPASAADMLVKKAPPRPPIPVWSWTGFYLGGHLGGAWAKSDWSEDAAVSGGGGPAPGFPDASIKSSSFIGGGQVGFDYQTGWLVFGAQADADLANLKGTVSGLAQNCFPQVGAFQTCTTNIRSMGTVTGRVGAAFDRALVYVLGGFAWEHEKLENGCDTTCGTPILERSVTTRDGWTIGGGLEYALAGNWSAFLQHNYMFFGTRDLQFTTALANGTPPFTEDVRDHIHVIKAGLNYRFNWAPMAVK
jgi:outer membrane immunogenic protein